MASPNVNGSKYWINGLPVEGIQQTTKDNGSNKYWIDGLPVHFLASYAITPPTNTNTPRFFVVFI